MKEWVMDFVNIILSERDWSWTLIAILFILVALTVRGWCVSPVLNRAKNLSSKRYHRIRMLYLKRSLLGWLFLIVSVIFVVALWQRPFLFPSGVKNALLILGVVVNLMLSIIFHLIAINLGTIDTIKEITDAQNDF